MNYNLKQADMLNLRWLQNNAAMLYKMNLSKEAICEAMKEQIAEFEQSSKHLVKILQQPIDDSYIELVDLRKDFVRTRTPNEESLVLRTKIKGIPIEVKLFKKNEYQFSNESVADALRSLADEVETFEFELSTLENNDVRALASGTTPEQDEQPEEDQDQDQDQD